jgi:hypothetical protein
MTAVPWSMTVVIDGCPNQWRPSLIPEVVAIDLEQKCVDVYYHEGSVVCANKDTAVCAVCYCKAINIASQQQIFVEKCRTWKAVRN